MDENTEKTKYGYRDDHADGAIQWPDSDGELHDFRDGEGNYLNAETLRGSVDVRALIQSAKREGLVLVERHWTKPEPVVLKLPTTPGSVVETNGARYVLTGDLGWTLVGDRQVDGPPVWRTSGDLSTTEWEPLFEAPPLPEPAMTIASSSRPQDDLEGAPDPETRPQDGQHPNASPDDDRIIDGFWRRITMHASITPAEARHRRLKAQEHTGRTRRRMLADVEQGSRGIKLDARQVFRVLRPR